MNPRQFFDKVALMRKLQKDYFKFRRQSDLQRSKALEREVDAEIERVKAIIGDTSLNEPKQPNLFE